MPLLLAVALGVHTVVRELLAGGYGVGGVEVWHFYHARQYRFPHCRKNICA